MTGTPPGPQVFHIPFLFIRHISISSLELSFLQSIPVERESRRGTRSLKIKILRIQGVFPPVTHLL